MSAAGRLTITKGLIHGIANCSECGWGCQSYLTVQRNAQNHAKRYGHVVTLDLGYAVTYTPKKDSPDA